MQPTLPAGRFAQPIGPDVLTFLLIAAMLAALDAALILGGMPGVLALSCAYAVLASAAFALRRARRR